MKRNPIVLSPELRLPLDVVTESVGIFAMKRVGKSNTAKVIGEQLFRAGQQVVPVDPKGDWWGLRSSADGKKPGLPIIIAGGEHGDVPLEPTMASGELVARMVVEQRVSMVLDLSLLRKREIPTFMTAFLETLYRMKARERYRTPMHLIVDEADVVAPQNLRPETARMLGAAEDIVRRGGQRGIGVTMVSQRCAALNTGVRTQLGVLFILRTQGRHDIKAIREWIDLHGEEGKRDEVMAEIAKLPKGTAWVWAPGWPNARGIFRRVQVNLCTTFDSGATPKPGQRRRAARTRADVDLAAFRREMTDTIERAEADDPKALRKRIAALEDELARARDAPEPERVVERVEVPVLDEQTREGLAWACRELADITAATEAARKELASIASHVERTTMHPVHVERPPARTVEARREPKPARAPRPSGMRAILAAAAQYENGVTAEQLTVLTGYRRSSRNTYLQRLRQDALIVVDGNRNVATDAGLAALGDDFEPLPTGKALRDYWLGKLPAGEAAILGELIKAWPKSIGRMYVGEAAGYKRSSRNTYLQRLAARELITVTHLEACASATLFERPR